MRIDQQEFIRQMYVELRMLAPPRAWCTVAQLSGHTYAIQVADKRAAVRWLGVHDGPPYVLIDGRFNREHMRREARQLVADWGKAEYEALSPEQRHAVNDAMVRAVNKGIVEFIGRRGRVYG